MATSKATLDSERLSGPIIVRDGAAIACTALGLGILMSRDLSPIVAGAGPALFCFGITLLAWPLAILARVRGHHGIVRAVVWGTLIGLPWALLAAISDSIGEAGLMLGYGASGGAIAWLLVRLQVFLI